MVDDVNSVPFFWVISFIFKILWLNYCMYICNIFSPHRGVCIEAWFIAWDLCSNVLVDLSIKGCLHAIWMLTNLAGRISPLKGRDEEEIDRENLTPDIETAVQKQWTAQNDIPERPRSETPTAALKKLSDSRKKPPKLIRVDLPKESEGLETCNFMLFSLVFFCPSLFLHFVPLLFAFYFF